MRPMTWNSTLTAEAYAAGPQGPPGELTEDGLNALDADPDSVFRVQQDARHEAAYAPQTRSVSTGEGSGLTGGGDLSADRSLAVVFATPSESLAGKAVPSNDPRLSDARTPVAHGHAIGDLPVAASGESNSTELVRADDSRLSDARTPTAHAHAIADLPVAASGESNSTELVRADDSRLSDARDPLGHAHDAGDVTSGVFALARLPDDVVIDPVDGINARLAASRRGPIKVVCVGSSTTAGTGATTPSDRWVNQFALALQRSYPSGVCEWEPPVITLADAAAAVPTLPGVHVINGGVGGTTSGDYVSAGTLTNIDTVAPAIVVHMIGANDYALDADPQAFGDNLETVIGLIDAQVPNVLHLVCDTYARPDVSAPLYPWADYVEEMKARAAALSNVLFVGQNDEWVAADASGYDPVDPLRLTRWRLAADIHPSDAGHQLLAAMVTRALRIPTPRPPRRPEVLDRFQRATIASAETGQPWEAQLGTMAPAGGALTVTTGGHYVVTTGFSDASVSALLTHNSAANGGIIAKSNDTNTRIAAFLNGPSDRVELYAGSTILGWTAALNLVSGREYFLKLTVIGDKATVELNGALVLTVTLDSPTVTAYAGYTKHGVRCGTANSVTKWRHFAVAKV